MKIVILAWWVGTRLRPLSTEEKPKQFLKLFGEKSLLQMTIERVQGLVDDKDIFVNTNDRYEDLVEEELAEYNIWGVILEPAKRNTAPAIVLVCKYLKEHSSITDDEPILFLPADHLIKPKDLFHAYIMKAWKYAQSWNIVIFGITPTRAETWYGYIRINTDTEQSIYPVASFVEKPDKELAQEYLHAGNYFRNSGMFVFSLATIQEEFLQYAPDILQNFNKDYTTFLQTFKNLPAEPFDTAIMEKTTKAQVMPMILQWSDVGSWDSLRDLYEKDERGNYIHGDVTLWDVHKSLIRNDTQKPIIVDKKENDILIIAEEWIYLSKRWESQGVKKFL